MDDVRCVMVVPVFRGWSVYCMYYTVFREDLKTCGLCPVKMMSYTF